jgi:hypothetical protein
LSRSGCHDSWHSLFNCDHSDSITCAQVGLDADASDGGLSEHARAAMSEWVNDGRSDMGLTDADWLEGWVRRLEAAEVRPVYMSFLRVHCVAVPKELHAPRPIYITIRTERSSD